MNLEKMNLLKTQPSTKGLGMFLIASAIFVVALAAILKPPSASDIELAKLETPIKIAAMQQKLRHAELEKLSSLETRKSERKLKCMAEITNSVTGVQFIIKNPDAFLELVAKTCP